MKILIDSRERKNTWITKALDQKGIEWEKRKLHYCDYSFEVDGVSYETKVGIERKNSLTEIASNFTKGRLQFEAEFSRAKADGCKVTLLIEDKNAKSKIATRIAMDNANIDIDTRMRKTWRSRFTGKSMYASIKAFKERYDLDLIFCHKLATAGEILKVFEEYLKKSNNVE